VSPGGSAAPAYVSKAGYKCVLISAIDVEYLFMDERWDNLEVVWIVQNSLELIQLFQRKLTGHLHQQRIKRSEK
jgi:hypothetical protein